MPSGSTGSFLRQNPVFATLSALEVEALAAVAVEATHRTRDDIFMEGDPARWFCMVKSGRVKILRHSRAGKDVVLAVAERHRARDQGDCAHDRAAAAD